MNFDTSQEHQEPEPIASDDMITVAIVDDHLMVSEALRRMFDEVSDIVVVGLTTTVTDGIALAASTRPAVVIADYDLPDGNGVTLARGIIEASPTSRVLMLTGLHDESLLVAAIEAGCAGFLTKDKAVDELVDAVRTIHDGEMYIQPTVLASILPQMAHGSVRPEPGLTERQLEILQLVALGLTNAAIASRLFLSVHTVRNHVQHILDKLGAHSKLEAVSIGLRDGFLTPPH